MSEVEPLGAGAGAGAGAGVGAGAGACAAGWWRRRLRFFFFGFLGLTGALGGRTVEGEMPPVCALEVTPGLFGPMPPASVVLVPEPPDGAVVPPVAAEALAVPHTSTTTRARTPSSARNGF